MNIVVRKDKRQKGIGSKLLEKIFEIAKEWKAQSITLEVSEKNKSAINLYQKFDFQQVGLRKKYYHNTDNAIIMSCQVGDVPFSDKVVRLGTHLK